MGRGRQAGGAVRAPKATEVEATEAEATEVEATEAEATEVEAAEVVEIETPEKNAEAEVKAAAEAAEAKRP